MAQVLIWGLEGSNVEACKNLVLAGATASVDFGERMGPGPVVDDKPLAVIIVENYIL